MYAPKQGDKHDDSCDKAKPCEQLLQITSKSLNPARIWINTLCLCITMYLCDSVSMLSLLPKSIIVSLKTLGQLTRISRGISFV